MLFSNVQDSTSRAIAFSLDRSETTSHVLFCMLIHRCQAHEHGLETRSSRLFFRDCIARSLFVRLWIVRFIKPKSRNKPNPKQESLLRSATAGPEEKLLIQERCVRCGTNRTTYSEVRTASKLRIPPRWQAILVAAWTVPYLSSRMAPTSAATVGGLCTTHC